MRTTIIFIILVLPWISYGQDPQFSQYFAAPLYLNPAFAGTSQGHRFIANYRNQWPNLANGFVTYAVSYDYNLDDLKSGIGLIAMTDRAGSANLNSTSVSLIYSYKIQFENKWVFTPGLSFGYVNRSIDFDKLVFGDQLDFANDGQVPSNDQSLSQLGNANYFDFGVGGLLYSKNFWIGYSAAHLNRPNRSLLNEESEVPIKSSIHAGFRIPLYTGLLKRLKSASLAPSFIYKSQGEFDQLDIGLYFIYDPIMIGLWYRGIPIQQNVNDNISQDALVIILGMQLKDIQIGYSYDFTVSELGTISGGAHEISLQYNFNSMVRNKAKKPVKFIPCPTFPK